ncbi:unnamed protein product, partial [Prorocentrum cordatum]
DEALDVKLASWRRPQELHREALAQCAWRNLSAQVLPVRAGDVVLWHEALLHGGSAVLRPNGTRRSLVFHYNAAPERPDASPLARALLRRPPARAWAGGCAPATGSAAPAGGACDAGEGAAA